ncbi:Holliday junction branch migration protein RuvA [Mycoplasmoides pneumoniae]|uniref:Holliday junction branch migration protein RuvA n=1 Tax=Mycoplasmoides pneumoniae TaxID=2104 RepID=UPI00132F738F|nr:Holliday junction branch migration protein RuvA [Mycoplasmoides pneumoniae]
MIASIFGKITFVGKRKIIVEANCISYWFNVKENHSFEKNLEKPRQVFCQIIKRMVTNQILEESFAFNTLEEKEWFSKFIELNGIGSKTALNLLNNNLEEMRDYIKNSNYHALTKLTGSNSKVARALLALELYDRDDGGKRIKPNTAMANDYDEMFDTLKSLGYKPQDIQNALSKIEIKPNFDVSEVIAEVIKLMSFQNNEVTNKTA